ncbi:hypothetical protein EU510_12825 [Pseudoalteromonas sp. FUC4]|nr:hypothetical protein EU510_12825 [Pseudoalteromonas sp. FUC4]
MTQHKYQTRAALWVRPKGGLLFVARFLLSPLGYKPRAAIKPHLDRTNFNPERPTDPSQN